jgi:hypothetical protein
MSSKKARVSKPGQRMARSTEGIATIGTNGGPPRAPYPLADDLLRMPQAYLIRIAKREDRERAIVAFMHVPRTRCRFTNHRYLVTRDHIEALQRAGIPFEDITDASLRLSNFTQTRCAPESASTGRDTRAALFS